MIWLQRGLLVLTLIFAAATMWIAVEIRGVPMPEEFDLPNGFETPILAMEFPRSFDDLRFIRSPANEPMREHIEGVQAWDNYFPYAYAGLLLSFSTVLLVRLGTQSSFRWTPILLVGVTCGLIAYGIIRADLRENDLINEVVHLVDHNAGLLRSMSRSLLPGINEAAWFKWSAIAYLVGFISAFFAFARFRVLAALAIVPVAATLYARFIAPSGPAIEFMAQAIAVFFLAIPVLAVYFLLQSFRRTEPENESPRQVET
ncbi:hypothetical protein [Hyphobacterium sp.]|uniref:hypothetical protein n=1 Tax=Hyphobacterium sp. TaxID=2004662 RepID=UPI00374A84BF